VEANVEFLQLSADAEACEECFLQAIQRQHDLDPQKPQITLSNLRHIEPHGTCRLNKIQSGVNASGLELQHATFHNGDRCAVNTFFFCGLIKGDPSKAVMVFLDNASVDIGNGTKLPLEDIWTCRTECAEDDVNFGQQSTKMDPSVKLHSNSPIMQTENSRVREGRGNGTQATFQKPMLEHGETISQTTVVDGIKIGCVVASQIFHTQLCHTSGTEQAFRSELKAFNFNAKFPKPPSLWTVRSKTESTRNMSATQGC
jgi:hypothetical protein